MHLTPLSRHLRNPLKIARGHGSAQHGVGHWWAQRMTALAMVPLSVWFIASLLTVARSADPFAVTDWLSSPYRAILLALLVLVFFWHGRLGFQVVVEDYVKCPWAKYSLLLLSNAFAWLATAACWMAIVKMHVFTAVAGV